MRQSNIKLILNPSKIRPRRNFTASARQSPAIVSRPFLRRFVKKIHPDVVRGLPELQRADNERSLKRLLSVFDPKFVHDEPFTLVFHVPSTNSKEAAKELVRRVRLREDPVSASLQLFKSAGIDVPAELTSAYDARERERRERAKRRKEKEDEDFRATWGVVLDDAYDDGEPRFGSSAWELDRATQDAEYIEGLVRELNEQHRIRVRAARRGGSSSLALRIRTWLLSEPSLVLRLAKSPLTYDFVFVFVGNSTEYTHNGREIQAPTNFSPKALSSHAWSYVRRLEKSVRTSKRKNKK